MLDLYTYFMYIYTYKNMQSLVLKRNWESKKFKNSCSGAITLHPDSLLNTSDPSMTSAFIVLVDIFLGEVGL